MIALLALLSCAPYAVGYQDGCDAGTHYGGDFGGQCASTEVFASPWPAYLLSDGSYADGRDVGYDDCYWSAFDAAFDAAGCCDD